MKKFLILLLVIQFLTSCASKQDLNGLATISSLLVAVPLVPFAEAYHVINDTEGKAKANLEHWRKHFDPIYEKRIEIISDRNSILDAELKFKENKVAFFPSAVDADFYIGMIWGKEAVDGEKNQKVIDGDELLSTLQKLLQNDPSHQKIAGYKYHSQIHDCFIEKSFEYRAGFNRKMSELSGLYTPSSHRKKEPSKCVITQDQ